MVDNYPDRSTGGVLGSKWLSVLARRKTGGKKKKKKKGRNVLIKPTVLTSISLCHRCGALVTSRLRYRGRPTDRTRQGWLCAIRG
jgi:hypothetical protein